MRLLALVFASAAVALAGCAENDRAVNLNPGTGGAFTFAAPTSTVMTENDDGAAEEIRRDWLAGALAGSGLCPVGYAVDARNFVQPVPGPFANGGDIGYSGHCLPLR